MGAWEHGSMGTMPYIMLWCYCRVSRKVPYLNRMRVLAATLAISLLFGRGADAQGLDHSGYHVVLAKYVSEMGIRYSELKADRSRLDLYVAGLGTISEAEFDQWPRAWKLAYLINAYNALVLQQVLDNYPIKRSLNPTALIRPANSVWQVAGFFGGIRHRVAGRSLTLDQIEHELLRAQLKEPRIHAALVCAAVSCPPLRAEPYEAARIDAQLDDQWRRFLADAARNRFDRERGELKLSEIFKWFAGDFGGSDGVVDFISDYVDAPTQAWLRASKYRLTYFDYDWTLNDASPR
ncbi:MAG: DUF547 domain-containing protein [Gemmatimonadota bacterium]